MKTPMTKTPMNNRGLHTGNTVRRSGEDDEDDLYAYHDIKVVGDHVWFYAPISSASSLKLNAILQDLSMRLAPTAFSSMHEVGQPSPIWLHINSTGGEVFSAFAMADTIQRISAIIPIVTIVEGCAASGATFMSIAGSKRLMRKNAFMLVHELRSGNWGSYSELKDDMTNNNTIMKAIKEWYKENTKIPEKEMDNILSRDIWWNAKTCLKYGLIDQII